MTLVICWLDHSFNQTRICAIADARASEELPTKKIVRHSDLTQKLFLIDVRSYAVDAVIPGLGASPPYHETKIGVGFSGHCFEALTVIAYLERSLAALVDVDSKQPLPEPEGIIELARQLVLSYLTDHEFARQRDLTLLLFGFSDDRSWAGTVSWNKATRNATANSLDLEAEILVSIGDGSSKTKVVQETSRLRSLAARQLRKVSGFNEQAQLRRARLEILRSSVVVAGIKKVIDNEYVPTVGGAMQKIELLRAGDAVIGTYVKDTAEHILNQLPSVSRAALLTPLPIEEPLNKAGSHR